MQAERRDLGESERRQTKDTWPVNVSQGPVLPPIPNLELLDKKRMLFLAVAGTRCFVDDQAIWGLLTGLRTASDRTLYTPRYSRKHHGAMVIEEKERRLGWVN